MADRIIMTCKRTIIATAFAAIATCVTAAAPPNTSGRYAEYFKDMKSPAGSDCCGVADCRFDDEAYQDGDNQWHVDIEGKDYTIPENIIRKQQDNITGRPILCRAGTTIYCFTPPTPSL